MISKISNWFGRNGNNIIQLINCIYYSFYLNNYEKIIFPKHNLLNNNTIINKEDKTINYEKKQIVNNFFYAKKLGFTLEPVKMREPAQKYLITIVNFKIDYKSNNKKLYFHIRAGDVMRINNFMMPNPLKLYKMIIEEDKYDEYIVVYEDNKNVVVNELKKLNNKKIIFQSSSLKNDLETLLEAKNLLICFSTFSLLIFFLSKNIEHLLIPKFILNEWYKDMDWGIKRTIYNLENYKICDWKRLRTSNQKRDFLINYNGEITSFSI